MLEQQFTDRKEEMKLFRNVINSGLSLLWITFLVLGIDRFSKIWMMENLIPYESIHVLPFFNLTLAFNRGAAFSFLQNASGWQSFFLGGIALVVSVVILVWLARKPSEERWLNTSLCLILGGALGNVWDRLQFGNVIDFLHFYLGNWHFAIFNLADAAICIGTAMLMWHWFRPKKTL